MKFYTVKSFFRDLAVAISIAFVLTASYVYYKLPSHSIVNLPGNIIQADELVDAPEDLNVYGVSTLSLLIENRMDFVRYWIYDKKIHFKYMFRKLDEEKDIIEQRKDDLKNSIEAEKEAGFAIIDYVFDHYSEEEAFELLGYFTMAEDYYGDSASLFMITTLIGLFEEKDWINSEQKIVMTGSFDAEGNVLPVGGVPLKAITAKESDAQIFIVPKEQVDEAFLWVSKRSDLEVVGVETIEELLVWLDENVK